MYMYTSKIDCTKTGGRTSPSIFVGSWQFYLPYGDFPNSKHGFVTFYQYCLPHDCSSRTPCLIAWGKDGRAKVMAFTACTTDKSSLICTVCTKTGHNASKCLEILNCLEWWGDHTKNSGQNFDGHGHRGNWRNGHGRGGRNPSSGNANAVQTGAMPLNSLSTLIPSRQ